MNQAVITHTEELLAFCEKEMASPLLAIDTEFVRENTYYPKLCLIQIASADNEAIAVDTLSDTIDLEPLKKLLTENKGLKLFHAGKQDLEILSRLLGFVPTPMFDTQVAAQLLGFGDQIGYEALVRDVLGKSLDKSQQYTNWSRRPLSEKQVTYALNDVLFLREIYPVLLERLKAKNRLSWMDELMQPLTDVDYYRSAPEDAWRRLSRRSRHTSYLARLRTLSEFREIEAEQRNLPRQWIFTDDTLQELALHPPKSAELLQKVRLGKSAGSMTYDGLMGAIEAADPSRFDGSDLFDVPLAVTKNNETLLDLLKLAVKVIAEKENISPRLLAASEDLIEIAMGKSVNSVLSGWRYAIAGEKIAGLLDGKYSLKITDSGKIELV
ncbi:MAG: ribonuclease D [Rickettsiales bacterium]